MPSEIRRRPPSTPGCLNPLAKACTFLLPKPLSWHLVHLSVNCIHLMAYMKPSTRDNTPPYCLSSLGSKARCHQPEHYHLGPGSAAQVVARGCSTTGSFWMDLTSFQLVYACHHRGCPLHCAVLQQQQQQQQLQQHEEELGLLQSSSETLWKGQAPMKNAGS